MEEGAGEVEKEHPPPEKEERKARASLASSSRWKRAWEQISYFKAKAPAAEAAVEKDIVPVAAVSEDPLLCQLTARELEVLELICGGYSNRDIAKILVISEHTVNDYTKKIYRKLDVHSRHAAAQIINRQVQ